MTIQELIEQLSKFDSQTEVLIECTDPTDYRYTLEPISIELGEPVIGDDEDWDDFHNEENEYIGEQVVLINIGLV